MRCFTPLVSLDVLIVRGGEGSGMSCFLEILAIKPILRDEIKGIYVFFLKLERDEQYVRDILS
jgi:hypothetical protein